MESISSKHACRQATHELLRQCVAGEAWDARLLETLAFDDCADALFGIVAEGLADRFEPRLCRAYTEIFSRILARCDASLSAEALVRRYERVRQPRVCGHEPAHVVVLSRVTLGADIAITSVIVDAVKRRFPRAVVYLAGSEKAFDLFAADPRVQHLPVAYPRVGGVAERIRSARALAQTLPRSVSKRAGETIVVDPDSRLTQLGLLAVCEEPNYFFFESRAYGGDGDASLGELTAEWAGRTFEVECQPRIAPRAFTWNVAKETVTVSLGAGGNGDKTLPGEFEAHLVRLLCARFADVVVDEGFGSDEATRVARAVAGTRARTFRGTFAQFASVIAQSGCYVGYDSGGQHAAAVAGTPLLTLFKGYATDRMFARWQPRGPGPKQILKLTGTPSLDEIRASLDALNQMV